MKLAEIEVGKTYAMELNGRGSRPSKAKVVGFRDVRSYGYSTKGTRRVVVYELDEGERTYRGGSDTCPPAQVKKLWDETEDARVAAELAAARAKAILRANLEEVLPIDPKADVGYSRRMTGPVVVGDSMVTIKLSRDEASRLVDDLRRATGKD